MTTYASLHVHVLCRQARGKRGQTLVEYALVLAVISVLTIVYMGGLGEQIRSLFDYVTNSLATAFSQFE